MEAPGGRVLASRTAASRAEALAHARRALDLDGQESGRLDATGRLLTPLGQYPDAIVTLRHCTCRTVRHDRGGVSMRRQPPGAHYRLATRPSHFRDAQQIHLHSELAIIKECYRLGMTQPGILWLFVTGHAAVPTTDRTQGRVISVDLHWCTCVEALDRPPLRRGVA